MNNSQPPVHQQRHTPATAIVDNWRSALRRQHQQPTPPTRSPSTNLEFDRGHGHSAGHGSSASQSRTSRPPSGLSVSTNPSQLSLDPLAPTSPATTADVPPYHSHAAPNRYGPSYTANLPFQRHSQPHPAAHHSSAAPASRSHHSLPGHLPHGQGRHHAQMNRVYEKPRYDADFDRSRGSSAAAASAAAGRELFNPNGPSSSSTSLAPPVPSTSASHPRPPTHRSRSRPREPPHPSRSDDALASGSASRRPRSKREPVDPSDLGRRAVPTAERGKDSKDSLESVETDFSGRTKSSTGGRRRRRREDTEEGEDGVAGASGKSRQLFDPRRDDPMRFTSSSPNLPGPGGASAAGGGGGKKHPAADARSLAGVSMLSVATTASYASETDLPAPGGGADDAASLFTTTTSASHASGRKEPHPAIATLKRAYREITDLEGKVQDEQKAAAKEREREEGEAEKGVRGQGGGGKVDGKGDEYWVRLAGMHKQLADAHYTFLTLAFDPSHPASLQQLPQRYNIPTRLWQVAFHSLLERMRHAVLSSSPTPSSSPASTEEANVLEHLVEFIQYAYGHYSQLFEDPAVAVFRAAWIEQLGDLARYRMAVAGLASRVNAASNPSASSSLTPSALAAAGETSAGEKKPRPADAASIGVTALNDWDLEEQDTWREMAREWYALGVAENPGTGRLQHHLALLSRGEELRGLYHYAKSLTAAHPYVSARESILPLFEDENQARRTQPDVSKSDLFVHLHGMLFTKISLDDFDEVLERFMERLKEEGWALGKGTNADEIAATFGQGAQGPFGDREWFMLGVINIAALLQYGAEDGVLKKLMVKEEPVVAGGKHGHHHSSRSHQHHHHHHHQSKRPLAPAAPRAAPQAIMVKREQDGGDETERPSRIDDEEDVLKPLHNDTSDSPDDDPLPFKLAQRLAFSLLSFTLRDSNHSRTVGPSAKVLNPYITLLLTFLSHLASQPAAFAHVERSIPWSDLVSLFNLLPSDVEVRVADAPNKLVGGRPLPEDWCIRGMDWAGRQLFGRGHWRDHRPQSARSGDGLPPPIEGVDAAPLRVESESDALKFDLLALTLASPTGGGEDGEFEGDATPLAAAQLAASRWRRLALSAAWMVRHVPGLDYDARAPPSQGKFRIVQPLKGKMDAWAREDEIEREQERLANLRLAERRGPVEDELGMADAEEESEDEDDEEDSEAVKELKARRRALKAVIRNARTRRIPANGGAVASKLGGKAASLPRLFAGFTVLVFDTNILLTSLKLFRELVEAECWTIVVPLAVITELDGLKRNATALGAAAVEMVDYLESAIRTHSRYLKIQTSRGNYLKDLAIRNESIDFSSSPTSLAASAEEARTMDDVILRAVSWQSQHFTSRLALVNPRAARTKVPSETAQVVLVTFDRNLRLKARARGLEAVDEKGLKKSLEAALLAGAG
ncbi:hypothetical protein JCM11641_000208 [Rhodosporidiobolus odoratus]